MTETRVLVVGAGPYGVAVARELRHRGVDFVIAGEPFDLWHRHTLQSMQLRSSCSASDVYARGDGYSLARFLAASGRAGESVRTPVTSFRGYLLAVTERLPFAIVPELVTRLQRRPDGLFAAVCSGGTEVTSRAAVVATGIGSHRYLPPALRALPEARILHTWDAREIEALRGQRLLVVGAGQSAAEAVDVLRSGNRVTWALRHRPLFWREPLRVPSPLFKTLLALSYGLYRSPRLVRTMGRALFRTTIMPELRAAFDDADVEKIYADADGLGLRATDAGIRSSLTGATWDRVIAATGYRFTPGGLPFLSAELRSALGDPDLPPSVDSRFQSAVENLYLAGGVTEQAFGPAMRFLFGSHYTARRLGSVLDDAAAACYPSLP
jgi:lysine/ornithine N-monooxygenase